MTEGERRPRLEDLRLEDFAPITGETFSMRVSEDLEVPVELVEATSLGARPLEGRPEAFALVFRGPPDLRAAQGIYRIEHERLGVLEIFVVPIGPDATGMRYEAIFN